MNRLVLILLLAWAELFYVVPAQAATTTELALDAACPGHANLAPHVDAAAREYLLHPLVLVAQMWQESGCEMHKRGTRGEVCAMQLLGVARNGHSAAALESDPALCIATGARWLALREAECGGVLLGLSGYNAKTCQGGRRYARAVWAKLERLWRAIRRRREAVS
jgi:hypothetical protein